MHNDISEAGMYYPTNSGHTRINRTGDATAVGGVYAIDLGQTAPASTDVVEAMKNIVPATSAEIAAGLIVVATETVGDDQPCQVVEGEGVLVQAKVTGGVSKGQALVVNNGVFVGIDDHARYHAIALETVPAQTTKLAYVLLFSSGRTNVYEPPPEG